MGVVQTGLQKKVPPHRSVSLPFPTLPQGDGRDSLVYARPLSGDGFSIEPLTPFPGLWHRLPG